MIFDTSDMSSPYFFMPGGLNLFSVALPVKTDKLVLKDLLKSIRASRTCKKNFRVTVEVQNVAIKLLWKISFAKNDSSQGHPRHCQGSSQAWVKILGQNRAT